MISIRESKLNELLKGLSQSEYKHFGDFINSPFHNKSQTIINLYDYLKKYSKDFSIHEITNEEISGNLYNDKKFNPVKVRSLISDFVKLIEQFLVQIQFQTYGAFQKVMLLGELNMRDLPKNFKSVLKETMKKQHNTFNRDVDYYYNQIFLENESFNYNLERRPSISEDDFRKIGNNIDYFFIISKLSLLHIMFYNKQNIDESSTYNEWLMNEIMEYLENNLTRIASDHPIIYYKYLVLMTIISPDKENYFRDLKKLAMTNLTKFDKDTKFYIFSALTNYCTLKCNMGNHQFKSERFTVFKIVDDKGIFDEEKFINYSEFLNAIISALEINKISWAEYFYNKYKNRIMPTLKEDTLNLAKAQILYNKKNFEEAIKLISVVSYTNHYFYLRSKMLISRIYYDKNELEPIEYILDAAKHYLKRNKKVTKMNREAFGKFFYFMSKILYLRQHLNPKVNEIKEELIRETNVSSKEWLMNTLNDINK